MRPKVSIIGAGNVGATAAQEIARTGLADVVLVDIVEGMPQGKALDLFEAGPLSHSDVRLAGANTYQETAGSRIVVITSGVARKPGMSRDDLLLTNAGIVQGVVAQVARSSPECIMIVVSNPLDAMAYVAVKVSRFPRERVVGMSGILDSARFRSFVAQEVGVSAEDVTAMVFGGHGDAMVPVPRLCTVAGIPLAELLPPEKVQRIVQRTIHGGAEIVDLLKTGSAFYAPGAAVAQMVDAVLLDRKRILPCCAYLDGEYGLRDVSVGVPVKLGAAGIEEIIQVKLTSEEQAALQRSAEAVRELVTVMTKHGHLN